ncbi:MAG: mismatch repair protein MutT [Solimicrobium sp.]|nr:mismatch repair protein MutT [Solimicrobium sp.]
MNEKLLFNFIEQVLATAQAGLTFSKDEFDIARFQSLRSAAANLLAQASTIDVSTIKDWVSLDQGYPTPKMDVRGMILDKQDYILLVRERCDGLWTLPGGWCDIGESAGKSVEREVQEETGFTCDAVQLLALFDKYNHAHPPEFPHAYKAFFYCKITGGKIERQTNETIDARFFKVNNLPELSAPRVLAEQIKLLHERIKNKNPETLFD